MGRQMYFFGGFHMYIKFISDVYKKFVSYVYKKFFHTLIHFVILFLFDLSW